MYSLMVFQLLLSLELLLAEGTFKSLLVTVHLHVGHQRILGHELISTHLEKILSLLPPLVPLDKCEEREQHYLTCLSNLWCKTAK